MEKIRFTDLYAQYLSIKDSVDRSISDVIESSSFVRGVYVDNFEEEFAKALDIDYCISCANGTDSLYLLMRALEITPGDEVIVPAHSWISTSETVTQAGGKIVFCDTTLDTFTIDIDDLKAKITERTVGIIPVHLYGQPADMDEIMSIARSRKLWVIEDCAQAHFSKFKGKFVGTFGDAASFSFYPGKNLGAMGDAGAVVTRNKDLANKVAMYARHGGLKKGDHQIEGVNSRMDGLQAAILSVKLPYLAKWTLQRQKVAQLYSELIDGSNGVVIPEVGRYKEHVWHLYVIRHEKRDELKSYLDNLGIDTVINYPIALPFLPAYSRFKHSANDFPNAFSNQSRVLSLPIYPEIPLDFVRKISSAINLFQV